MSGWTRGRQTLVCRAARGNCSGEWRSCAVCTRTTDGRLGWQGSLSLRPATYDILHGLTTQSCAVLYPFQRGRSRPRITMEPMQRDPRANRYAAPPRSPLRLAFSYPAALATDPRKYVLAPREGIVPVSQIFCGFAYVWPLIRVARDLEKVSCPAGMTLPWLCISFRCP